MKITIDTKHDSKEDIEKIIELLNKVINSSFQQETYSNDDNNNYDNLESSEPVFGNLFDQPTSIEEKQEEKEKEDKTVSIHELMTY